jgi:hypothetical protein
MTGGWAMKVTIDPAIEKDPGVLQNVRDGNRTLEGWLDLHGDNVGIEWTLPGDRPDQVELMIRSLDDVPVDVTAGISRSDLNSQLRRNLDMGAAISRWSDRRFLHHHSRLRELLAAQEA